MSARSTDIFVDFVARERFLPPEVPLRDPRVRLRRLSQPPRNGNHRRDLSTFGKPKLLERLKIASADPHSDGSHRHLKRSFRRVRVAPISTSAYGAGYTWSNGRRCSPACAGTGGYCLWIRAPGPPGSASCVERGDGLIYVR